MLPTVEVFNTVKVTKHLDVQRASDRTNRLGPSKQDYTVRDTQTDGTEIVYSQIMQPAVHSHRICMSGFAATIRIASDTLTQKGH